MMRKYAEVCGNMRKHAEICGNVENIEELRKPEKKNFGLEYFAQFLFLMRNNLAILKCPRRRAKEEAQRPLVSTRGAMRFCEALRVKIAELLVMICTIILARASSPSPSRKNARLHNSRYYLVALFD